MKPFLRYQSLLLLAVATACAGSAASNSRERVESALRDTYGDASDPNVAFQRDSTHLLVQVATAAFPTVSETHLTEDAKGIGSFALRHYDRAAEVDSVTVVYREAAGTGMWFIRHQRTFPVSAGLLTNTQSAQQQGTARTEAVANPITDAFKGFGYYGNWLIAAFDSIPANRYDYRPTPVQRTVGDIAQHLEDANYQLCARFGGLPRPSLAGDSAPDSVRAAWPKDTLVARLQASLLFCRDAALRVHDSELADEYAVGAGRTSTRARDLILFLTDLADHYSQIANYMRLMGMVPPSALPRG